MTCLKLWNVGIYLFANDTKISRQNNQRKCTLATIRHKFIGVMVSEMATHFSPKKCHVLTLGIFYNITHTHKYTLHWQELENVFAEKDLGVILDAELKVCEHVLVKVKKANALVALIHRTFSYLDGPLFKKLFTSFIRPHLEYDKVICTPHLKKIYNYFGNCAMPSHKIGGWFSSHELLRKAKKSESTIVGLQESSRRYDRDFQHFHSYDNCMLPENFRPQNSPSRKQEYQLVWKATKDGVRGLETNFFYFRTIQTWNELPKEIIHVKSINLFKNKLDETRKDLPVRFYE